mmetsp:Transcript_98552/g.279282  ORF Transcript_98552/g.279282 Transcript_98552/m.279282 type:complete len:229 (-) Transcript_98552:1010-1696(-)
MGSPICVSSTSHSAGSACWWARRRCIAAALQAPPTPNAAAGAVLRGGAPSAPLSPISDPCASIPPGGAMPFRARNPPRPGYRPSPSESIAETLAMRPHSPGTSASAAETASCRSPTAGGSLPSAGLTSCSARHSSASCGPVRCFQALCASVSSWRYFLAVCRVNVRPPALLLPPSNRHTRCRKLFGSSPSPCIRTRSSASAAPAAGKKGFRPQSRMWRPRMLGLCALM